MSKEKILIKNTMIVSIGKICTQLVTFFLLPLYTYVLSTEEFGIVDLLNTLVSLLIPIVTLQIDQGVFRYLLDCRVEEKKEKRIISSTIFIFLIEIIIYLALFSIVSIFINNEYKFYLAINLIVAAFAALLLQITRGMGDNLRYSIGSCITGLFTVLLNVLLIAFLKLGAYGMLIATILGHVICIVYIFFTKKIYKFISFKSINKEDVKNILKYSVPLVPNMLSWWAVNASDRLIIAGVLGATVNGIYSISNKFSSVIITLNNVFNITWTESASININSNDKDKFFSNVFDKMLRIFGALCIGMIAYMPYVFPILINKKFYEAYFQIPILILATLFSIFVSFLGAIYIAKKLTNEIAKTSIIAAIINIIFNLLFINIIGLYAASISTLVAYFSMFIYRLIDSRKYVKISIDRKLVISMIIMYIIAIVIYYLRNIILYIILSIIVTIYAIYINKSSAKFLFDLVVDKFKKGN